MSLDQGGVPGVSTVTSAKIRSGATTNRVKVKKKRRRTKYPPGSKNPPRKRYRADRSLPGTGVEILCISMPCDDLAAIDAAAEGCQMSRSQFLRQAAKHFAAALFDRAHATTVIQLASMPEILAELINRGSFHGEWLALRLDYDNIARAESALRRAAELGWIERGAYQPTANQRVMGIGGFLGDQLERLDEQHRSPVAHHWITRATSWLTPADVERGLVPRFPR